MSKYSKFEVQRVRNLDIRMFVPGCSMHRTTQEVECPQCGKKKFSIVHKGDKNFAYCHACKFTLPDPITAVAHYSDIDIKNNWLGALEETARQGGITITPEETQRQTQKEHELQNLRAGRRSDFLFQQLEGSGLTVEDVMATVIEGNQECMLSPFRSGTVDSYFNVDESGRDMLIYYYDLQGRPVTYIGKGRSKPKQYLRARWANTALHKDENGKEGKYKGPAGAKVPVFIPEKARRAYKNRTKVETLFLQEGEKKAEKACKHGMMSLGIQGINNIGSEDVGLIQEIQEFAIACEVQNIVLIMDSDWDDLHRNITVGDRADKRPNAFSKAVIKFRQYMRTFNNVGLSVNVWWGHVNVNEHGDKGVDDLLCGSLKGHEDELMEDVRHTMNTHDGRGKWLDIHKITELSDTKIRDYWSLNDVHEFYRRHSDRLGGVGAFKIGQIRYKVEGSGIVAVSRYSSSADIYSITQNSKGEDRVEFNEVEARRFLEASGFRRVIVKAGGKESFEFIRIDDGIIDRVATFRIRDFMQDYIYANCKSQMVLLFFERKLSTIMADKQLERLSIIDDNFNNFTRGVHRMYYNNGQVEITDTEITPGLPLSNVWRDRINARRFRRVPVIKDIVKESGRFYIEYTAEAERCDFLRYLINTSNNYYQHDNPRDITEEERAEWAQSVVNKITTVGYLLTDYKYASERKAVVVQDHMMTEVGQSHGGAGKSILGNAIGKLTPQFFIDGKQMKKDDEFLLSGLTKSTRNIFIDDVKTNFNFEGLFAMVTGPMYVNPKGQDRFSIPVEDSPKILITTNHAINKANEDATKRRISYMEYSRWYNPGHTIVDDFGHMFFDDWDEEQWNLFDNLMAECVMYYLRSFNMGWARNGEGAVPPPMRNIELRTLRQEMSEVLYQWAEEFYDATGTNLNAKLIRKELFKDFLEYAGGPSGHNVTNTNFKGKIIAYCKFKGYDFNINKTNSEKMCYRDWKALHPDKTFVGEEDKSNGKEYFTVYSPEKEKQSKPF